MSSSQRADWKDNLPATQVPLTVLVIGAGIGGLTAAIALRRQGHNVELFEAYDSARQAGAAINVVPNATSILLQLGVDVTESGAVPLERMRLLKSTGELLEDRDMVEKAKGWQADWLLTHRAHLHAHLWRVAFSKEGKGRPVGLRSGWKASSVDTDTATVYFTNGSSAQGTLVVGADGVHSATRRAISPHIRAQSSVHSAFRFLVTRKAALEDARTAEFFSRLCCMDIWYSEDKKVVVYPCANNETLNFVCVHPAALSQASDEYDTAASKSLLLEVFKDFDPVLLAMLEKADAESLKVYPLFDMETLPTYVKGRLALVGDAAHPFLPHLAQGGAMAIEDGVALGEMLPGNSTDAEIAERLQLYNKARYQRATLVQKYTRIVGGDSVKDEDSSPEKLSLNEYLEYPLKHNEIDSSREILRRWQASR